jgi:hypothetical protein
MGPDYIVSTSWPKITTLILACYFLSHFFNVYSLRDQWIRDGEGFLLIYSITSRSTFERIERFKDQLTRVKDTERLPVVLVGNKCDMAGQREVSREEGIVLARKLKCDFMETSAKTCVNVEKWVVFSANKVFFITLFLEHFTTWSVWYVTKRANSLQNLSSRRRARVVWFFRLCRRLVYIYV